MNCKPGDLAFVIKDDFHENIGGVVHVLIPFPNEFDFPTPTGEKTDWLVEVVTPLRGWDEGFTSSISGPGEQMGFPDSSLKPIRHGDGDDETFIWAGKPTEVNA